MDKDLLLAVKLYFSWILLLTLIVLLGGIYFQDLQTLKPTNLANWDGLHFLYITEAGYVEKFDYAFLPLYPILINIVSKITSLNFFFSGLLINSLSSFGIVYVFIKLLRKINEKNVIKILIYFLIFPTSFYLFALYTESLFLLFALLTFYFLFSKKILLASIFACLAASTRFVGLAVIGALFLEFYLNKSPLKHYLIALISFAGFFTYCIFLYLSTSDPFYFLVSQLTWQRQLAFPGQNFWWSINRLITDGWEKLSLNYPFLLDLLFTIFGLGIGLRTLRFLRPSLAFYTVLSLLIPFTTTILLSFPRFLIVIFPIFIMLGRIKSRAFQICYVVVSLTFLFLFFNFFLRGLWVS